MAFATLRHLGTGKSQISLSLQYRIEQQTFSKIIPETCKTIYDVLVAKYVNTPSSQEYWLASSPQFEDRWNLPHMVLLAVCDAKYCFTMLDVGQYGSKNDSGVLINSKMGKKVAQGSLNISSGTILNGCALNLPIFCCIFR